MTGDKEHRSGLNSELGCETGRREETQEVPQIEKMGGGRASSHATPYLPSKKHSSVRLFPVRSWMWEKYHLPLIFLAF